MSFKVISSKIVHRGRVFDVRQDQVLLPDGRTTWLDVVDHQGAVTIIPLDQDGLVWFVRQYRHPTQKILLELPAGVIEAGESAFATAQREIQEEIGMAAGNLKEIGGFYLAPGYSTEYMHLFLATNLRPSRLPGDESEFLSLEKIPARQAMQLTESGEIQDSKSLVALFRARPLFVQAGLLP